jgi:hypothetical protein
MTLPAQHHATGQVTADPRAEKERQRYEIAQQVAFKQRQLEERQLAEARRMAEDERQRREAERKQRQDEDERRLADVVRALEKERLRQEEVVRASLKHREREEYNIAEARRLADLERHRRETELAAARHQVEAERRLADAVRQLEKERVRQAAVVQASMKHRLDIERRQAAPAVTPTSTTGQVEAGAKPMMPRSVKYRVASGKAPKVRPNSVSDRRSRVAGPRHARRQGPVAGESLGSLCPWRWLERAITDLLGPVRVAERTSLRRLS